MTFKICGWRECPPTQKLMIAAEIVGMKVDFKSNASSAEELVVTADGVSLCFSAALRYLARVRPDLGLYGRTFAEAAQVDCAFEFISNEVSLALRAWCRSRDNTACVEKIRSGMVAALKEKIEPRLLKQTYLVGERLTIADLHLACSLHYATTCDAAILKTLPNVARWLDLITNIPVVKKHLTAPHSSCKGGKKEEKPAKKAAEKPAEKKEASGADIEDQIEAEAKAKSKKQNELDLLPPTSFVLDAWKRQYSNTKDLKGVAMPWFWTNLDPAGWSVWYMRYEKMEGENTVGFTTANMLGGFLQRLDSNFRKYSFGVINVVGETGNFDIQGVWMMRGQEIPFELKDHPSYEYYSFRKLDFTADKALIEEYWCNDETVEGRPIDACKVWK